MRVIAGLNKGQRLKTFKGDKIRPTSDRIREALFNIIANEINGSTLLDGYSGTAAVAIEFLSRGGKKAFTIDNSKESIRIINENLEITKLKDKAIVKNMNLERFLKSQEGKDTIFDIIFLDPPYEDINSLTEILDIIKDRSDDPLIIIEMDKKITIDSDYYDIIDQRKYGRVLLTFIKIRR